MQYLFIGVDGALLVPTKDKARRKKWHTHHVLPVSVKIGLGYAHPFFLRGLMPLFPSYLLSYLIHQSILYNYVDANNLRSQ